MHLDLVSDLHEDTWDATMFDAEKHPDSIDAPLRWTAASPRRLGSDDEPRILIVAGDVSDSYIDTCRYIERHALPHYDVVLVVDGNHEHAPLYPSLLPPAAWSEALATIRGEGRVVDLSRETFRCGRTAFLGCCGWWDYRCGARELPPEAWSEAAIEAALTYFRNWDSPPPAVEGEKASLRFAEAARRRGDDEVERLAARVEELERDASVDTVVIVTHTPPIAEGADTPLETYMHSAMTSVVGLSSKLCCWAFGHNHDDVDLSRDGVRFVAHPRGSQHGGGSSHAKERRDYRPMAVSLT